VGVVACALLAATAGSAGATPYTVGTTADLPGVCAAGSCSLRQLIATVHATPFPPDTISVPAGTYMLDPGLGVLAITDNLSIVGAGARTTTIAMPVPADRSNAGDRVFSIAVTPGGTAPTVAISGLTISGGTAQPANGFFGGDILDNSAALTLSDDWITNGSAYSGGAIANTQGTLTVIRSLISGNRAPFGGGDSGAILNNGGPATATAPDPPGHLVVDSSTITGNDARLVGGIFTFGDTTNTLVIANSTIVGNASMDEPDGPLRPSGGGLGAGDGSVRVQNSILAANVAITGGVTTPANCGLTAAGAVSSLGRNIDSGADCFFAGAGDLSNTDPLLGLLKDNGGPTDTFALAPTSPAIDRIPADANCAAADQRGVPRPQGPACDIGAYEVRGGPPAPVPPPPPSGRPPPATVGPPKPTPSLGATSSGSFLFYRGARTQVQRLAIGPLPGGATVLLSCTSARKAVRSARCPFKRKTFGIGKPTRSFKLVRSFKHRRLARGTTFEIRATKPDTIGFYARYTTRNRNIPSKQLRCLPPGTSAPVRCQV